MKEVIERCFLLYQSAAYLAHASLFMQISLV